MLNAEYLQTEDVLGSKFNFMSPGMKSCSDTNLSKVFSCWVYTSNDKGLAVNTSILSECLNDETRDVLPVPCPTTQLLSDSSDVTTVTVHCDIII